MKKASQRQIAEETGLSQALVSLVLNGKQEGVAKESQRKIWESAERLGYRTTHSHRPFDGTQIQTIGYVLRDPLRLASTSNFFSEVHEGLDQYLSGSLARTTFLGSESDLHLRPLKEIVDRDPGFRGIVIMGEIQNEAIDLLLNLKCPLVYISARAPGVCHSINANEVAAAELAVSHLLHLGHHKFAYLGSQTPTSRTQERRNAFFNAIRRSDSNAEVIVEVSHQQADRKFGWGMAQELLKKPINERGTAWVCVGGLIARGALDALTHHPDYPESPITLISLDQTQICSSESPSITAVGTNPHLLGKEAGKLLLGLTQNDEIQRDLALPASLQVGNSSFRLLN